MSINDDTTVLGVAAGSGAATGGALVTTGVSAWLAAVVGLVMLVLAVATFRFASTK